MVLVEVNVIVWVCSYAVSTMEDAVMTLILEALVMVKVAVTGMVIVVVSTLVEKIVTACLWTLDKEARSVGGIEQPDGVTVIVTVALAAQVVGRIAVPRAD
jgi:hypothetical protein